MTRVAGVLSGAGVWLAFVLCTGCYSVGQGIGRGAADFATAVAIAIVVVCGLVAAGLVRADGAPRLRAVLGVVALVLFGWALAWAVEQAAYAIPFDPLGYRVAFVPIGALLVPIAAARGRARWFAATGAAVAAVTYALLIVSVRPGSRLPPGRVIDVAIGNAALCALFDEGGVACVGDNTLGEVGVGHLRSTSPWALAIDLPRVESIRGAGNEFCAFTSTGVAYCWGERFGPTPRMVGDADALRGEAERIPDDEGHPCTLDATGRVTCGDQVIPLDTPVAALRGANGLVCAALSVRAGVLCWGTTSIVRLQGTPEQTRDAGWVGMFGPRWVWHQPAAIDWP